MNEKPFRVVNCHGVAWAVRFASEDAAWGRLLALNGGWPDTAPTRRRFIREGWKIIDTRIEVASTEGEP
jgi:hypothetical protein